jgi:ribonuclease HI
MDNLDENAINIFTDGSMYSNPRVGGMGIRFVVVGDDGHEQTFDYQPIGSRGATNQQMELLACIEALNVLTSRHAPIEIRGYSKIIINTDSRYVVDNFDNAKYRWRQSGWLTRDRAPVLNAGFWKELVRRVTKIGLRVEIRWVKGHKDSVHNRAADRLAKASAKNAPGRPVSIVSVRRKKTSHSLVRGSVEVTGQRLTIRIITDEYLKVQRCYKYKYEVMSKASSYYGLVDLVFSDVMLRAGHTYYVRMNDQTKNPRIVRSYREVLTELASEAPDVEG